MCILFGLMTFILLVAAIVLFRALKLKPTAAKIELDHLELAREYGRRLAKMIQKETISYQGALPKAVDFYKNVIKNHDKFFK